MRQLFRNCLLVVVLSPMILCGGMPSPLPTPFTKDSMPHAQSLDPWIDERLQALSFFVVAFLVCAAGVNWLWKLVRHDWPQLPSLTYRRSLAFTFVWGLVAIIVLTMISGARELMTPGAWRKQGWTYKLAAASSPDPHFRSMRRSALEQLRVTLLKHAALNRGQYPVSKSDIEADWKIPAHPGFEFHYRPGLSATSAGELIVFEPETGDEERFVLLGNGLIGTMRTPEIEVAVNSR